jgi:hypothetical protein
MTRHIFMVQTNPVEGREDEYKDWHANVTFPECECPLPWGRTASCTRSRPLPMRSGGLPALTSPAGP